MKATIPPTTWLARLRGFCRRLHRDEAGAANDANDLIKFALIAVPLILLLLVFKDDIIDKTKEAYNAVMGDFNVTKPTL